MQIKKKTVLVLLFWLICVCKTYAAIVSGRVTDNENSPLPFANVYLEGTTIGTTTNIDGFYTLQLAPGQYNLVFRYIGFELKTIPIEVKNDPIKLNAALKSNNIVLKAVTITAKKQEDPAYAIIRNAQKERKKYLEQVKSYTCNVYIKGVQKIIKYPSSIMGYTLNAKTLGILDSTSGIVYMSEAISNFSYEQPDKVKEEMVSSKVSGDNKAFSFTKASDFQFSLYENIVKAGPLSDRGFVSPISPTSMLYYKYKLIGTFQENGETINKIEVKPSQESNPAFSGYIYISDSTWRIHSVDVYVTKKNGLKVVDTLKAVQTYAPVTKDIWMLISAKFSIAFNLFGVEGNGNFVQVNSNYTLNGQFDKKYFSNEVMHIDTGVNKKDTSYWEKHRPVPLTGEERKDYTKRDSMQKVFESKPYQDSLDKTFNKFKWSSVLFGYSYNKSFENINYRFDPLIQNLQFNTVEGFNLTLRTKYSRYHEGGYPAKYSIQPSIHYGFTNKQWAGNLKMEWNYNQKKFANATLSGGIDVVQFNENNPITPLINTFYTLFDKNNFMKLYRKNFVNATHSIEVANGIVLTAEAEYAHRQELFNTDNYNLIRSKRTFTLNEPISGVSFGSNDALSISIDGRLRIAQKYSMHPNRKVNLGSKYPTLLIGYVKGFNKILGSDVDYDLIKFAVYDRMSLGMFGKLNYRIGGGKFINSRKLYFMDYKHFSGNQTIISSYRLERFNALPYYVYSTSAEYLEAHAEHNFGGFILNKFPLIRKLRITELASIHYLKTPAINYLEVAVGLQRGLLPFKLEFYKSFSNNVPGTIGFRLGLPIVL